MLVSEQEVAALVLGYLKDSRFTNTFETFRNETEQLWGPSLQRPRLKSLPVILTEYLRMKQTEEERRNFILENSHGSQTIYSTLERLQTLLSDYNTVMSRPQPTQPAVPQHSVQESSGLYSNANSRPHRSRKSLAPKKIQHAPEVEFIGGGNVDETMTALVAFNPEDLALKINQCLHHDTDLEHQVTESQTSARDVCNTSFECVLDSLVDQGFFQDLNDSFGAIHTPLPPPSYNINNLINARDPLPQSSSKKRLFPEDITATDEPNKRARIETPSTIPIEDVDGFLAKLNYS